MLFIIQHFTNINLVLLHNLSCYKPLHPMATFNGDLGRESIEESSERLSDFTLNHLQTIQPDNGLNNRGYYLTRSVYSSP